ncbi:hypothetical protein [Microbacterium sp. CPCC 204701]|uniref:hypothetical protein n=1 Tax=Microbacterium sp. CPCC 204701 TaxID=2493084 RepID=UPI000FD7DA90|nr:hypothetical protein [Microbacterium sp. CPCC 204701]
MDTQAAGEPFAGQLTVGSSAPGYTVGDEGGAAEALGWIIGEGVDVITAMHDIPADGRVQRRAGDQLRAYVMMLILDILDRSLYSVELTANEQTPLDCVKPSAARLRPQDRAVRSRRARGVHGTRVRVCTATGARRQTGRGGASSSALILAA